MDSTALPRQALQNSPIFLIMGFTPGGQCPRKELLPPVWGIRGRPTRVSLESLLKKWWGPTGIPVPQTGREPAALAGRVRGGIASRRGQVSRNPIQKLGCCNNEHDASPSSPRLQRPQPIGRCIIRKGVAQFLQQNGGKLLALSCQLLRGIERGRTRMKRMCTDCEPHALASGSVQGIGLQREWHETYFLLRMECHSRHSLQSGRSGTVGLHIPPIRANPPDLCSSAFYFPPAAGTARTCCRPKLVIAVGDASYSVLTR
jgi:hypothetical protein